MASIYTRDNLLKTINADKATLVSPIEGTLAARTDINYVCVCGKPHHKILSNLLNGKGGAICPDCAIKRGVERRLKTLKDEGITTVNKGATEFNRELAEKTASKDGSTLLGIYSPNKDGSQTEMKGSKASRDCFLRIKCNCGKVDFINFRQGYEGLCLCAGCRKGHRSDALRSYRRGEPPPKVVESPSVRSARIEREGQECIDCGKNKKASDFSSEFNSIENCKVYDGRCFECSRKLRTSKREESLRNGSLEDFMKAELEVANDRTKKYNRKHPNNIREFTITVAFLVELFAKQDGKCALTGCPMKTNSHRDDRPDDMRCNPDKMSIDRIDSKRGYTKDNVQLLTWITNSEKMNMTNEQFLQRSIDRYKFFSTQLIQETNRQVPHTTQLYS
jgi:hypothetical protein